MAQRGARRKAERLAAKPPAVAALVEAAAEAQKPARRSLPEHLPREEVVHPAPCVCPSCGRVLRKIGEDVTETLDYVPGRFKVIRDVRDIQTPAPYHPIARGRAGARLLAHVIVSSTTTTCRFYRQAEIYAREGVELETSTLSQRKTAPVNRGTVRAGRDDGGLGERVQRRRGDRVAIVARRMKDHSWTVMTWVRDRP